MTNERGPMRIALADPPNRGGWRLANHPNLGILYLSSYLKSKFKGVDVLYLEQQLSLDQHLEKVKEYRPDLYGISFSSMLVDDAVFTIKRVKEIFPELKIICGGPHPSALPNEVASIPGVDVCAIGEGEETCIDLVRHFLLQEKELEDIPGIAFLKDQKVIITPKRPFIKDIDSIHFPDWDLINFADYKGNYQYKASPSTAMVTTRGCAYNCNFCSNPVWKTNKPWVRMRSPENVCEEVTLLYNKGIRDIYIRSDDANVKSRWCIEVFKAIKGLGYKDLYFQCNIRGDRVTEEMARLYSEIGGWLVYLGIESGSDRTLAGIGKKITLDKVIHTCRILKRYDIDIFALFMIYHAWEKDNKLYYETYKDVNDGTLRFIRWLRKERLIDYISFTTTTPMPGSKLYETAIKYKIYDPNKSAIDLYTFSMNLPGVTKAEMKRTRLKGMLLQLWFVLASGRTLWSDFGRIKIKLKYLIESILP